MAFTKAEMDVLQELGNRIRALREQKGWSQQQLADQIDKERQSISRIELGQINPSYLQLRAIAAGLGIDVSNLTEEL